MDRTTRKNRQITIVDLMARAGKKITKDIKDRKNAVNEFDLVDKYGTLHLNAEKHTQNIFQ